MRKLFRFLKNIAKRMYQSLPNLKDERTFLNFQIKLRESDTPLLNEAMLVLDIIDAKTSSLLNYISISLAAMVFLITSLPNNQTLKLLFFGGKILIASLLLIILALLVAIVLSLSCLNIVGAHTIKFLKSHHKANPKEYEELIINVTLGRRKRYLVAHRISVLTVFMIIAIFVCLFLGSIIARS